IPLAERCGGVQNSPKPEKVDKRRTIARASWGTGTMAVLVRTRGTHNGQWVFPLANGCLLGRHATCDVSDIFKDVRGVSRHHAQSERAGDEYFIEDGGSRNGTLVNGKRLAGRRGLRSGDRIDICRIELTFYDDAVGPEPTRSDGTETVVTVEEAEARSIASVPVAPPGPPAQLARCSEEKLRALASMLKRLGNSLDTDATLQELLAGLFAIFR